DRLFGFQKISAQSEAAWYKTFSAWQLTVFLTVTFIVAWNVSQVSFMELLNQDGFAGAVRLFQGISHPNFGVLPRAVLTIIETIFIAFMAAAPAIPAAFILSFFCARNLMKGPVAFTIYRVLRAVLNFIRGIEALIWVIIVSVWVGIGPFAGMLALM